MIDFSALLSQAAPGAGRPARPLRVPVRRAMADITGVEEDRVLLDGGRRLAERSSTRREAVQAR